MSRCYYFEEDVSKFRDHPCSVNQSLYAELLLVTIALSKFTWPGVRKLNWDHGVKTIECDRPDQTRRKMTYKLQISKVNREKRCSYTLNTTIILWLYSYPDPALQRYAELGWQSCLLSTQALLWAQIETWITGCRHRLVFVSFACDLTGWFTVWSHDSYTEVYCVREPSFQE